MSETPETPILQMPQAEQPVDTETREERRERAAACGREVEQVLAKYRCTIRPFLSAIEPVGNDGRQALIGASYGFFPY